MENFLDQLYQHTSSLIKENRFEEVERNLILLEELSTTIMEKSINIEESTLFNTYKKIISNIASDLAKKGNPDRSVEMLIKIYKNNIETETFIPLYFEEVYRNIFLEMEQQPNIKTIKTTQRKLLSLFYLVKKVGLKLNNDINLPSIISFYYVILLRNKHLDSEEKKVLIDNIIEDVIERFSMSLEERILSNLLKTMIDNKDINSLKKALDYILKRTYHFKEENLQRVYLKTLIYLYYLSFREDQIKVDNEFYKKVLSEIVERYSYYLSVLSYSFYNYYNELKIELHRWELIGTEEAKMLVMDYVVRDFFIFFSTMLNKWEFIETLKEEELFSFLDSYLDISNFNEDLENRYREFSQTFDSSNDIGWKLKTLKNVLVSTYKFYKVNELNTINIEMEGKKNNKIITLEKELGEALFVDPLISAFTVSNENLISREYDVLLSVSYPSQIIEQLSGNDLIYYIKRNIMDRLITLMKENGFSYTKINYLEQNLLEVIAKKVVELESNDDKIDSLISGYFNREYLLSKQTTSLKKVFGNIIKSLKNDIEFNYPMVIGFSSENSFLTLGPLNISVAEYSDLEISQQLENLIKDSNDNYLLRLTNRIYAPFAEEEAREYIRNEKMIFKISMPIKFKSLTKGFIIEYR